MMLLVSGATATVRKYAADPRIGHLLTPGNGNMDSVWLTGLPVCGDNQCFTKLNKPAYVAMLDRMRGRGILWVACPDVVANADATLLRFRLWRPVLEYYQLPIAFVAQDGQEDRPVPWDAIRCLFIGGGSAWKEGAHAARLICEAHERGKWVHVGRVNTLRRYWHLSSLPIDSIDGTCFSKWPDKYIPWMLRRFGGIQHRMESLV